MTIGLDIHDPPCINNQMTCKKIMEDHGLYDAPTRTRVQHADSQFLKKVLTEQIIDTLIKFLKIPFI